MPTSRKRKRQAGRDQRRRSKPTLSPTVGAPKALTGHGPDGPVLGADLPAGLSAIRLARPDESTIWRELTSLAQVPPEPFLESAIASGTVSSLLLPAARSRPGRIQLERAAAKVEARAVQMPNTLEEELLRFVAGVALPLVAVDDEGTLVGALQAMVSGVTVMGLLQQRFPLSTVMSFATKVVKIAAVGVTPSAGRRGVGQSLLRACCQTYFAAEYDLVHGSFRRADAPALAPFYERAGFELPSTAITFTLNGRPAVLDVDVDDQQLFAMNRERWLDVQARRGD